MPRGERASAIESIHFWHHPVFKSPIAWALTFFFGIQSVVFYSTATWMPTILTGKGFNLSGAGVVVSITGMIGSAVGVIGPNFAAKRHDLRLILVGVSLLSTFSYGMCIPSHGPWMYLWLALGNIGLSLSFPLALMLTVLKGSSALVTKNLSIMMQAFGYFLAALGPGFVGFLHDSFHAWGAGLAGVVLLSVIQVLLGLVIGKPGQIA
jgi:CP family cyanate transporter-like MFS transporter